MSCSCGCGGKKRKNSARKVPMIGVRAGIPPGCIDFDTNPRGYAECVARGGTVHVDPRQRISFCCPPPGKRPCGCGGKKRNKSKLRKKH
ncbi:hypothetical protein SAMN05661091_3155 [Paenibacillus uliginis N3/975]|uniref:Uncharacterized protein n=1 Tax=Paenibacillus uliginis N3/975 TaxID=1313296 RepID=A0A1X7HFJ9_9BACL|nr:hypothetical protein SAMN05661091_3155 [Paenibacillus uliginis N3/975]